MFNRHFHIHPNIMVTEKRTVIEQRAPTDESVRLLKEMEEAARAKIVESLAIDTNEFKAVLHAEYLQADDRGLWVAIFDLNGKRLRVEHSFPGHQDDPRTELETFVGKIGREIAVAIVTPAINSLASRAGFQAFVTPKL